MYIFILIWLLFIFVYTLFNAYGIYRVLKMRIKGDMIPGAVMIYIIVIFVIVMVTIFFISRLDWSKPLSDLIKL